MAGNESGIQRTFSVHTIWLQKASNVQSGFTEYENTGLVKWSTDVAVFSLNGQMLLVLGVVVSW